MAVVVSGVVGQHSAQVAFAEDQHPVGQLGPRGQHEPLRESIRAGTAGRNLHHVDAGVGKHGVEDGGELAGPIADEILERCCTVTKVEEKIPGLLGGPRPVGVGGDPEDMRLYAAKRGSRPLIGVTAGVCQWTPQCSRRRSR